MVPEGRRENRRRDEVKGEWEKRGAGMNKAKGAGDQVGQQTGGTIRAFEEIAYFASPFFYVCDLALKLQECGSTALAL